MLRINAGDEIYNEINECTLAETLEFAERNGCTTSYTYKNNLSYRITEDAFLGNCTSCGEPLASITACKSKVNFIEPRLIKSMMEDVTNLKESFRNFDTYDEITSLKADTYDEISSLKADTYDEITSLKTDIYDEIASLKADTYDEITSLKADIYDEITSLKADTYDEITSLKADIYDEITSLKTDTYMTK